MDLSQPFVRFGASPTEWIMAVLNRRRVWLDFRLNDIRIAVHQIDLSQCVQQGSVYSLRIDPPIVIHTSATGPCKLYLLAEDGLQLREMSWQAYVTLGDRIIMDRVEFRFDI